MKKGLSGASSERWLEMLLPTEKIYQMNLFNAVHYRQGKDPIDVATV
jgi:hypothetical protein